MAETTTTSIRRGLPRVRGGEPWPPAAEVQLAARSAVAAGAAGAAPAAHAATNTVTDASPAAPAESAAPAAPAPVTEAAAVPAAATPAPAAAAPTQAAAVPGRIRRGLPRVAGGPAWPDIDDAALAAAAPAADPVPIAAAPAAPAPPQSIAPEPAQPAAAPPTPAPAASPTPALAEPAPAAAAAPAQASARPASTQPPAEPRRYRGLTLTQWVWRSVGAVAGAAIVVLVLILAARGLLTFRWAADFVKTYPGSYALPAAAPTGMPVWLEWQHFLNTFFMLLVIRTGIQIRGERKPPASWSPRWNPTRRISLTVWLHTSLDLLWVLNGVVFLVALFATGQWMRIVPTSWSVFPNALTAAVKYASLNWPTEDGWVNYNSLQQLSYFAVVFLLAPLAIVTGVRMSGLWQKKWERASKVYPAPLARAVHFPTMIVFCAFIVVHVALVFATGALRNLNHMYGHSDVVSWTGFWVFVATLVVLAGGWVAARPLVVSPIASLFGKVGR